MAYPPNWVFTQLGSDNFQRANENPLSQGGKWTSPAVDTFDALKIVSDQCVPGSSSGGPESQGSYTGAKCLSNPWAQITIETLNAGSGVPDGFAYLELGLFNIGTNIDGLAVLTIAPLGSGVTLGEAGFEIILSDSFGNVAVLTDQTVNVGDTFLVAAVGSTLYAFQNSTLLASGPFSTPVNPSAFPYTQVFAYSGDGGSAAFINFMCGTVSLSPIGGFSPNWYEGQLNAGLAIYVSPGGFGGTSVNGQIVFVPANSTSYLYLSGSGVVQVGASLPVGAYGIALVVSGEIQTGTPNLPNNTSEGILSITDIRS